MWYTLKDFHLRENYPTIPFTCCTCEEFNDYAKTHQESKRRKDDKGENPLNCITPDKKGLVFIVIFFYLIL
jgi:hypothetical protein